MKFGKYSGFLVFFKGDLHLHLIAFLLQDNASFYVKD